MLKGGASPLGTIPLCSTSGDWAPEHCGSLPVTGTDSCSLERHGGTWSLQKLPQVGHNWRPEVPSSHQRASQLSE